MWRKILYNKAIKNSHQNIKFGASFCYKLLYTVGAETLTYLLLKTYQEQVYQHALFK